MVASYPAGAGTAGGVAREGGRAGACGCESGLGGASGCLGASRSARRGGPAKLAALPLRAGGGDQKINLTRTLSQASEANGLAVKRLQPNSRGEVQIRFEGVAFDNLLQFLEQIEGVSGLAVLDASVSSAGRSGGVNATFRVAGT